MITAFANWRTKTATLKRNTVTVDSSGVPQETEQTVASGLRVNFWTDQSVESNVNDKFVDQATGRVILPHAVAVDTTMWLEIDGEKHYVTGVDDVGGFGDVLVVSWRRQYGG